VRAKKREERVDHIMANTLPLRRIIGNESLGERSILFGACWADRNKRLDEQPGLKNIVIRGRSRQIKTQATSRP
jgi:hypothetical protein